jgi:hypothetical protein
LQGSSVDEERRGAGNADAITLINIMLHRGFMDRHRVPGKLRTLQRRVRPAQRIALNHREPVRGLRKKNVVIVPKLPLVLGAPGGLCGAPRLRMNCLQWKIPIGEPQLARIAIKQLFQRGVLSC